MARGQKPARKARGRRRYTVHLEHPREPHKVTACGLDREIPRPPIVTLDHSAVTAECCIDIITGRRPIVAGAADTNAPHQAWLRRKILDAAKRAGAHAAATAARHPRVANPCERCGRRDEEAVNMLLGALQGLAGMDETDQAEMRRHLRGEDPLTATDVTQSLGALAQTAADLRAEAAAAAADTRTLGRARNPLSVAKDELAVYACSAGHEQWTSGPCVALVGGRECGRVTDLARWVPAPGRSTGRPAEPTSEPVDNLDAQLRAMRTVTPADVNEVVRRELAAELEVTADEFADVPTQERQTGGIEQQLGRDSGNGENR